MTDISITRAHSLSMESAKAAAQRAADELAREFQLASHWQGDTLVFHRSGIAGRIEVAPERILLEIRLGLLLRGFRRAIEQSVNRRLDEVLGAPA